jgi:hypothetical protein
MHAGMTARVALLPVLLLACGDAAFMQNRLHAHTIPYYPSVQHQTLHLLLLLQVMASQKQMEAKFKQAQVTAVSDYAAAAALFHYNKSRAVNKLANMGFACISCSCPQTCLRLSRHLAWTADGQSICQGAAMGGVLASIAIGRC